MFLGAHESVAGGLARAFEHAGAHTTESVQIFTKNSNQWREPTLDPAAVSAFRDAHAAWGGGPIIAHSSYLINLGSDRDDIRTRSLDALVAELERCDRLGVRSVALHPGAAVGSTDEEGVLRAIEALSSALERTRGLKTKISIENTAGQGSVIGWSLEQLTRLVRETEGPADRLGVCIDTQHLFAAGYDLRTARGYDDFWDAFDRAIGIARIDGFHLNDSKRPLGERVDRHEEIGAGYIGLYPFWRLVNDPRFERTPGIVELEPEPAAASLERLRKLRGAPEPAEHRIVQPLELKAPEPAPAKRRGRRA